MSIMSELNLNNNEYCYLVTDQSFNSIRFKVKIPKIMPYISGTTKTRESFNKNIFINDDKCKPTSSSSLTIQPYITIKKFSTLNLLPVSRGGIVPHDTRLECMTYNKNNYEDIVIYDY